MMILKIAWRNLWRSKLRSFVVIISMTVGLVGGLFSAAWLNGMTQQRVMNAFDIETSHIQIHHPKFADNMDLKMSIENTDEILAKIDDIEGVEASTSRIFTNAMAATASKNLGVNVYGIDLERENEVFKLYDDIKEDGGSFFETKKRYPIVVSSSLAEKLKVKLKSKIVLTFQDYNGEITGSAFKVVGIFKTQNSTWDKLHVFVKESDMRSLMSLPDNYSHEIDIKLNDFNKSEEIKNEIASIFPDYKVEEWREIQPFLRVINDFMGFIMTIFIAIILAALGFGIVNTMLMVILERTRELGMLMAIGMTKRRIFSMIMVETVLLTLVGAFFGELISILLINYFGTVGIDLSYVSEGMVSAGYSPMTYPALKSSMYIQITIMVIITGIISSIYPAIKALKLHPTEAIRTI